MTSPLTDQQLAHYAELEAAATPGPWHATDAGAIVAPLSSDEIADVWEPTQASRNGEFIEGAREAVPVLLAEVRRLRFRIAELGEQGPDDRETVSEAAQMYRSLRPVIERTMADPDRWDGDEDESFHLGRYVEWLAAQVPPAVAEAEAERLAALTDCPNSAHGGLHCLHYQEGDGPCCNCQRPNWCPGVGVTSDAPTAAESGV